MHSFFYRNGQLQCEGMPVQALAEKYGTPLYIYSQETVTAHFQTLDRALARLDHRICFAVKSNSNLAVLRTWPGWAPALTSSAKANCGGSWPPAATPELRFCRGG